MSGKTDRGWRWFKFIVILVSASAVVKILFAIRTGSGENAAQAIIGFIGGVIIFGGSAFLLGWLTGPKDNSKTNSKIGQSPIEQGTQEGPEDQFFLQVAKEMVSGLRDEGLWAKAFALQDGDEKKTKAHYIRLRVEQLGRHDIALKSTGSSENRSPHETIQADGKNPLKWVAAVAGAVVVIGILTAIMTPSKQSTTRLLSDAEVGFTAANTAPPKHENPSQEPPHSVPPTAPQQDAKAFNPNITDQRSMLVGRWHCKYVEGEFTGSSYLITFLSNSRYVHADNKEDPSKSWELLSDGSLVTQFGSLGPSIYKLTWFSSIEFFGRNQENITKCTKV